MTDRPSDREGPFGRWPIRLLGVDGVTRAHVCTYAGLSSCLDHTRGSGRVNLRRIAERSTYSLRTVQRCLDDLVRWQVIGRRRNAGRATFYRLLAIGGPEVPLPGMGPEVVGWPATFGVPMPSGVTGSASPAGLPMTSGGALPMTSDGMTPQSLTSEQTGEVDPETEPSLWPSTGPFADLDPDAWGPRANGNGRAGAHT